ncbi:hypothetical protein GGR51DRAFT_501461 [Nemania sp. FL0031]|nr:hypothetical protein GGR51DRAFT_501461 [Nemania sp. FL0031]
METLDAPHVERYTMVAMLNKIYNIIYAAVQLKTAVHDLPVKLKDPKNRELLGTIYSNNNEPAFLFQPLPETMLSELSELFDQQHTPMPMPEIPPLMPEITLDAPVDIVGFDFCRWADGVGSACRRLTNIRDELIKDRPEWNACAGFDRTVYYEESDTRHDLLRGEWSEPDMRHCYPLWRVNAFVVGGSRCIGGIMATHCTTEAEDELHNKTVLRAELLAMLYLFRFEIEEVLQEPKQPPATAVLLLSFTPTKVRVLQARYKSPCEIYVSVRTVLDNEPEDRDKAFRTLIAWSMFVVDEGANSYITAGMDVGVGADADADAEEDTNTMNPPA